MAGQIVRRGDRRWLVRIYLGRDRRSGKRLYHNRTIHGSKKDAEQYRTKKLRERDLGLLVEPSRISVDSYLDQWLETAARQRVRPRTFEDYTWLLNKYVRPRLGRRRLDQVQPFRSPRTLYRHAEARDISPDRSVHTFGSLVGLQAGGRCCSQAALPSPSPASPSRDNRTDYKGQRLQTEGV